MPKINTDYGAQALDLNQLVDLHGGTGIVSGCSASVGTNAMEVDVASGTARVNGTNYSVTASTVLLDSANADYPRKDLVVVDNTGSVTKITGTAEEAKPAGSTRRNTRRPRPSDISGSDVAVIAEVWVGAGASDIVSGDISDRRIFTHSDGFKDTNGDGVAELDDSHADFQGGDARNVGALDADELLGNYPGKVRAIAGGQVVASIDPANTTTPVQDAVDAVSASSNGRGTVLLPPEGVTEESGPINWATGVNLIGHGYGTTQLTFADTNNHGIVFDGVHHCYFDGVNFVGADNTVTGRYAMHFINSSVYGINIGRIAFQEWGDDRIFFDTGHVYSAHWEYIKEMGGAIGNNGSLINAQDSIGPGLSIANLYPGNLDGSPCIKVGSSTTVVSDAGLHIDMINAGTDAGPVIESRIGSNSILTVNQIHDFGSNNGNAKSHVVHLDGKGKCEIGSVRVASGVSTDWVFRLGGNNHEDNIIRFIEVLGTLNLGRITVDTAASNNESYYFGPAGHVTNNSAAANGNTGVHCLRSAGTEA